MVDDVQQQEQAGQCYDRNKQADSLDLDAVAGYLKSRIPSDGPYTLTMDRTNWKFGEVNINALVLGIAYDHMSFPILFRLLPKRGNSNCKERINILQRLIRLFGRDHNPALYAGNGLLVQGLIQVHRAYCLAAHPDCSACPLANQAP